MERCDGSGIFAFGSLNKKKRVSRDIEKNDTSSGVEWANHRFHNLTRCPPSQELVMLQPRNAVLPGMSLTQSAYFTGTRSSTRRPR